MHRSRQIAVKHGQAHSLHIRPSTARTQSTGQEGTPYAILGIQSPNVAALNLQVAPAAIKALGLRKPIGVDEGQVMAVFRVQSHHKGASIVIQGVTAAGSRSGQLGKLQHTG